MKRTLIGTVLTSAAIAVLPATVFAATTITIDSVIQRWPWNNRLDITYTVGDGQNVAAGEYKKIVFTTVIDGKTYTIDGVADVGASADTGTHTVTWTLPEGVKDYECTMSAAVYSSDFPSGDDYMIVDLTKESDNIVWEGLLATQDASNERYNTAVFKTDKLVLRKVPAGGPYPTGDSANYSGSNSSRTWTTDRDYYIGVFPVTQYQYQKLYGSNPSEKKAVIEGNEVAHRPVESVSWDDLRLPTTALTSSIPAVDSKSGTFFQRLNYITGNRFNFDLPTEVMFEIAGRAGAMTVYYWGDSFDGSYAVYKGNAGGSTVAVGSRLPNNWGLYDTAGNVWEWCRDIKPGNLAERADAFTPDTSSDSKRSYRGGPWTQPLDVAFVFSASFRGADASSVRANVVGFRVSWIAD